MEVHHALHTWRREHTLATFGRALLWDLGPAAIMPNLVVQCIVDCAHVDKITTVEDLKKETKWERAEEYGGEILDLIRLHLPQAPAAVESSNPFERCRNPANQTRAMSSALAMTASNLKPRNQCWACGSREHISEYYSLLIFNLLHADCALLQLQTGAAPSTHHSRQLRVQICERVPTPRKTITPSLVLPRLMPPSHIYHQLTSFLLPSLPLRCFCPTTSLQPRNHQGLALLPPIHCLPLHPHPPFSVTPAYLILG